MIGLQKGLYQNAIVIPIEVKGYVIKRQLSSAVLRDGISWVHCKNVQPVKLKRKDVSLSVDRKS